VLLHGLFGSGANWHGIARRLAAARPVLVPDLRNHGRSPHAPEMDYPAMADDLAAWTGDQGLGPVVVVGHSMGGKAAMELTLRYPRQVAAVGVVDIAPVRYPDSFETLVDALRALPLGAIANRADADRRLAGAIASAPVRAYLLQNLVHEGDGWRWRFNLPAIAAAMAGLRGFPDPGGRQFAGPALFLYGTESSYVGADALPAIRQLFPLARLRAIANAGHWVYADRPDAFIGALEGFLAKR
jgi:pimeloyl-ACP methyl ester carboxylesterase